MESGVKRPTREVPRTTGKVTPTLERAIVLPLEGKGDRSAVDEVTCSLAPLREASIAYCLLPTAFECRAPTPHSSLLIPHLNQKDCRVRGDGV